MKSNIAIIGSMGSGKTTIAQRLVQDFGYQKFSFAKEVKDIFNLIYKRPINKGKGTDRETLQDIGRIFKLYKKDLQRDDYYKIQSWIQESQEFLKYFMEQLSADELDCALIFNPDFYLDVLMLNDEFDNQMINGNVVIDDMRFFNEGDNFHQYKSWDDKIVKNIIIKLNCPQDVVEKRLIERDSKFDLNWLKDVSETSWQSIKHNFEVDATQSIDQIMEEIKSFIQ